MTRWMVSIMVTAALISCLLLAGCGDDGTTGQIGTPVRHQGVPTIEYCNLSNYSIELQTPQGTATVQDPPIFMALGLTAGDTDIVNLELAAELVVGTDANGYPLLVESSGDTRMTVKEIKAQTTAYLTIPLYLNKESVERLAALDRVSECTINLRLDPDRKQSGGSHEDTVRSLSVVYLPQSSFDLPLPSQDRRFPPYSNVIFKSTFDKPWGIEKVAYLYAGYSAISTWEPMSTLPNIPYAAALQADTNVYVTVFWNDLSLLKGTFYANANLNYLTDSGYKGYLELFGKTKLFDKEEFFKGVAMNWAPSIAGNFDTGVLPLTYQYNIGGGVILTIKGRVEGTYNVELPGNLAIGGTNGPLNLNQAFLPDLRATLVSSLETSNTRYGISMPMQLADLRMQARLKDLKVTPSVPNVDASFQWPGQFTMLKGSIWITDNNKPRWKVYEYSILDKSLVMDLPGFLHGNKSGITLYPGEYHLEDRK